MTVKPWFNLVKCTVKLVEVSSFHRQMDKLTDKFFQHFS